LTSYSLTSRKLLQVVIQVDSIHHVLLFIAVGTEGQEEYRGLQSLGPFRVVGENVRCRINSVVVLCQFKRILVVSMIDSHEREVLDLVLFHILFSKIFTRNFTSDNRCSYKVLFGKCQPHLFENELDLVLLGEGTVSLDVDFL